MMIAKHGTAAQVDRLVRLYRQVRRTEALEQENHRHEMRELTLYQDDDGSFVVHGRLTRERKLNSMTAGTFVLKPPGAWPAMRVWFTGWSMPTVNRLA